MPEMPILVNGKPFFGRVEEQKRFRAALREVLHPPPGEDLPYVFLLYGDGGIGKTTLALRFRDIALEEVPFAGEVEVLWVDWEEERRRYPALRVGWKYISVEDVFDTLFTVAQRQGWEKHFRRYREIVQKRKQAEQAAARALMGLSERPDLAELRSASAAAVAKILRAGLAAQGMDIGSTGEQVARAFVEAGIRVGAEEAERLLHLLKSALQARLGVEQFELYVNPHEGLARALADGFRRLANKRALMVVMDTYEIVDRVDPWIRMVMRLSGPRTLWVLSGRNDLVHSRRFGREYLKGYAEEWPRRFQPINMLHLAYNDVDAYFRTYVPERPLKPHKLEAIVQATRGIPLAVAQAAEMWAKELPLEAIVGDLDEALPAEDIVSRMTERYLVHAVREEDRYALYALALARGDREVLQAMLAPEQGSSFHLNAFLQQLERRYASVYAGRARLHDDPQAFFEAYLRQEAQRTDPRIREMLERAAAALQDRLARIAADYELLEERLEDEDYQKASLDLCDYLFWLDEDRAWRWWVPRFVEALAYSPDLSRGLLEVAERWKAALRARSRRRLKAFRAMHADMAGAGDGLWELERLSQRGYLAGEDEAERKAVLAWLRGRWLHENQQYEEALQAYETAAQDLPARGRALQKQLAEAVHNTIVQLMWPEGVSGAVHHPKAVPMLQRVVAWQPENATAWYHLGVALYVARKYDEAEEAYRKAIQLDPNFAVLWNGLGIVYRHQGRYEEAEEAYRKAIQLDPNFAAPWYNLGNEYADQGRYEEAEEAYRKAIQLDPKDAYPWNGLGVLYTLQGKLERALEAFRRAVELEPNKGTFRASYMAALRRLGREEEARREEARARALMEKESEYNRACFAAMVGEKKAALRLLKIALEKTPGLRLWARRDPDLESLHDDPRFWALVGEDR